MVASAYHLYHFPLCNSSCFALKEVRTFQGSIARVELQVLRWYPRLKSIVFNNERNTILKKKKKVRLIHCMRHDCLDTDFKQQLVRQNQVLQVQPSRHVGFLVKADL